MLVQRIVIRTLKSQTLMFSKGVTFPADNVKPMMDEIVSKLNGLKKFTQVIRAGETPASTDAPTRRRFN